MSTEPVIFKNSLSEYFKERLTTHSKQFKPKPHQDTLWYLSNMLARFGKSDQVFTYDEGTITLRPLALLYKDAHEARSARERCLILRQLGDLALFMGALFPEAFTRRGIHHDYLIGMGGSAYDYLSENAQTNDHIFSELSTAFPRMLRLVAMACSRENVFGATDIFNLYQRWLKTKDPLIQKQLQAVGIDTLESNFTH